MQKKDKTGCEFKNLKLRNLPASSGGRDGARSHGVFHSTAETVDGDRGRIEVRRIWATEDITWLADRTRWPGLRTLVLVEAERTARDHTRRKSI